MTRKLTLAASLIMSCFIFLNGQVKPHQTVPPHRTCGTEDHHQHLLKTRPGYKEDLENYNKMIDAYLQSNAMQTARANSITIPVVIHVVYQNATENISDAQAQSQLDVLNADFQKLNSDTGLVPSIFKSKAGGVNFTFCLAQRDPSGNATTGIIHKQTTVTSFSTDDRVKSSAQGGDDPWDVTRYMNVWICDLGSSLLGYGEFPTSSISNTWGLVINYTCAGTMGTATAPFNKGRTGTHEFGHCFNLYHIWGDDGGACTGSDQCSDTPNQKSENYGTPSFPQGTSASGGCCTSSDQSSMYMNYMDYVDDAAMYMFTQNQCARMIAVVSNSPWNVLQSSNACQPVNVPTLDAGISGIVTPANGVSTCNNSFTPVVTLKNFGSTALTSCTIQYKLDAGAVQNYNWTGSLASMASVNVTLPSITGLTSSAHTYTASTNSPNGGTDLNVSNNSSSSTFTVTAAPTAVSLPFTEGFQGTTFVPTGWSYTPPNPGTNQWTRTTTAGGFGTSTACAKMDNFSGSTDITGQRDILRTPALNLSNANSTLKLKFDVAYARYSATYNDSLNVYISTDCGGTWTKIYSKGGQTLATAANSTTAFTPTAAQWRKDSVSLSSYAGTAAAYIRFENVSGWSNNLYLDNINIAFTASSAPPAAAFTSASTKCAGTAAAFTDASTNSPTSWSWSTTPSAGVTIASATSQNPNITFASAGTYTVSLTASNSSGSNTTTQTVTVNATPTVTASNQTVCAGNSATITATGASSYSWNTGASTASLTVTPTSTTTYTVTGTTNGCVGTKTVSVTVNALPNTAAVSQTVCAGNTATVTASGASSYSWNTGASTASITVSPAVTTTYTVTGTGSNGCTKTATATVTVNSLPAVTAASNAAGDSVCSGNQVILNGGGAANYSWTGGVSNGTAFTPSSTQTYTVTGTAANNCSNTASITITVSTCLGVEDMSIKTVVVYPNPASDVLTISMPLLNGTKTIEIFDARGRIVEQISSTNSVHELSLQQFAEGNYFIRVVSDKSVSMMRFIVQK